MIWRSCSSSVASIKDPEVYEAYLILAQIHANKHQYVKALEYAEIATDMEPVGISPRNFVMPLPLG